MFLVRKNQINTRFDYAHPGGFSSDLYRALVCDMKKLGFFLSKFYTNMEYYPSTLCQQMIDKPPGQPPRWFFN